jgi:hypothetical protein
MLRAYNNRPEDFKRITISLVLSCKEDLYEEEQRWMNFIKPEEIKTKYYNLTNKAGFHWTSVTDENHLKSVGEKISIKNKGRNLRGVNKPLTPEGNADWSQSISEGKKIAFEKRIALTGEAMSEEHRLNLSVSHIGKIQTDAQQEKKSASLKQAWAEGRHTGMTGRTASDESRAKQSLALKGRKLEQDQIDFMKINNSKQYLITYKDGSSEKIHGLKAFGVEKSIPYVSLFKAAQHSHHIPKYNIDSVVAYEEGLVVKVNEANNTIKIGRKKNPMPSKDQLQSSIDNISPVISVLALHWNTSISSVKRWKKEYGINT